MKKSFFILFISCNLSFSQYAVVDFFVIKDGMESQYLSVEKVWKNYHQSSVDKGEKISWSLWKRSPREGDKEMVPDYVTFNTFNTKEEMDNYINDTNIVNSVKLSNKGKISSRNMNKVLSLNPVNAHRRYCIQLIDATPLTGGDPKIGDKMEGNGMIQKQDDYEDFESYVYKPIFLDEVMKGNMRWWALTKIIDRSDSAYEDVTHFTWRIHVDGKKMSPNHTKLFGNEFVSKKMRELTGASRDIRGRGTFTMIDKTL